MSLKNKRILVTGSAGFIGSHLVDKCLKEGAEHVTILDNFVSGNKENIAHLKNNKKVTLREGDVRDFELVKKLVKQSDIIFNEAASKMAFCYDRPRFDVETNVIGPFNIIQAALDTNVRIVHASTGSVFGSSNIPMAENHPTNPVTQYGISKLAGEKYMLLYAKTHGLKTSVIRYFHVFGPRQDYSGRVGVVGIFIKKAMEGQNLTVMSGGSQIRCFTYVSDDVDATIMLAKKNSTIGQDYNVASKTRITIEELAKRVIQRYGSKKSKIEYGLKALGENYKPIPDTSKIEKLGFREKVSLEKGLDKTKEWIEERMRA